MSPHVSAVSDRFWARETELLVENIRRFRAGRRLRNLVDPDRGY
jgi:phosphoglycerate dehydrogenase-like enzyme